jgi:hypothetical protein
MLKNLIKYFIRFIHILMILFMLLGAFLPKKYLIYFIFALPLLYLHWLTNNNKCISTEIECCADKQPYCSEVADYPFLTHLLNKFDITVKDKNTKKNIVCYGLTSFWFIALYRYYTPSFNSRLTRIK